MGRILITGGTVFVSRYAAQYFLSRGHRVWVLNRNTRPQVPGTELIQVDRNCLGDTLKGYDFDAVLDINSYTRKDVQNLVCALGSFRDYIFISSSAVYPETLLQPFREDMPCGENSIWGSYGVNKLEAESYLQEHVPQCYILRPPYLYGPMENVYRSPFVFDCAHRGMAFCLPEDGALPLQFFHVEDLCRMMECILQTHPKDHIFNVGNPETVTAGAWAELCYRAAGKLFRSVRVTGHPQRSYFPFHPYAYRLDVSRQMALLGQVKPLEEGLKESHAWHQAHPEDVLRRPYLEYIQREGLEEGK